MGVVASGGPVKNKVMKSRADPMVFTLGAIGCRSRFQSGED